MIKFSEKPVQLAELVDMSSPEAVLEEVKYNFIQSYSIKEFRLIRDTYKDFMDLYRGQYQGYKGCNTLYHDIEHTTDVILAFSRLLDGYNIENKKLPVEKVLIGMIVILFHDSGYCQKKGSGSKKKSDQIGYIQKSINFIKAYFQRINLSEAELEFANKIMHCIDIEFDTSKIKFKDKSEKIVGYMVGTADLTGQMSARTYLEKLFLFYDELRDANIVKKNSMSEILKARIDFYRNRIWDKFEMDYDGLFKYHTLHFIHRYGVDYNLYMDSIEKQIGYLEEIIENSPRSFSKKLKRKKVTQ